jgi:hypothetical protein
MTTTIRNAVAASLFTTIEIRELAVRALVCEAALKRFLGGLPVRPLTRARIERALREQGIELDPVPESER